MQKKDMGVMESTLCKETYVRAWMIIDDESIDFVFCNIFPGHYDSGELRNSPYMNTFMKKILLKMTKNGIFYYGFHTSSSGSDHPTCREDVV